MIQDAWENVLGITLAQNSQLMDYRNMIITIKVTHPTWQKEFKHLEKHIITKFNNQLGMDLVSKIQFIK